MVRKVYAVMTRNNETRQHLCGLHIRGTKGKGKGKHKGKGTTESDSSDGVRGEGKGDDQGKGEGKGASNGEYQLSCLISATLTDDPEIRVRNGGVSDPTMEMTMTGESFHMVASAILTPGTECIRLEMEQCDEDPADAE